MSFGLRLSIDCGNSIEDASLRSSVLVPTRLFAEFMAPRTPFVPSPKVIEPALAIDPFDQRLSITR